MLRSQTLKWVLAGGALGLVLAVVNIILSGSPVMRPFVQWVNAPWQVLLEWMASLFHEGNTDQLMGVVLWGMLVYWILIGIVIGLLAAAVHGRLYRSDTEEH